MLCRMHECRSLSASCLPRHLHLPVRRERRDAQERPLFALRVDNFSGREIGRYLVAPVGRGPGAKRIKRKVRGTFLPLSGFAMEGEPRLSSTQGLQSEERSESKRPRMDFFNN